MTWQQESALAHGESNKLYGAVTMRLDLEASGAGLPLQQMEDSPTYRR